jgi:hypothetical protein
MKAPADNHATALYLAAGQEKLAAAQLLLEQGGSSHARRKQFLNAITSRIMQWIF